MDKNVESVIFSPAEAKVATKEQSDHNDNDTSHSMDGQHKQTGPRAATIWPRLQMFKIQDGVSSFVANYSKVVEGMENVWPGVEFRIKLMPTAAMEYY